MQRREGREQKSAENILKFIIVHKPLHIKFIFCTEAGNSRH